jgi:hypothetical protein
VKRDATFWVLVAALVIVGSAGVGIMLTRGIRNKNPGNLRFSTAINWVGQTGFDDEGYAVFDSMENGVRAMVKDLRSKIARGVNTISKILYVYAPVTENPTSAYIAAVSHGSGIDANAELNDGDIPQLVPEMIKFENGPASVAVTANVITEGIRRAYLG